MDAMKAKKIMRLFNRVHRCYRPVERCESWYQARIVQYLDWDKETEQMLANMRLFREQYISSLGGTEMYRLY